MKTLTSKITFSPKNFIWMRVVIHLQSPLKSNGNLERIWRNDQRKHGIKPVGRDSRRNQKASSPGLLIILKQVQMSSVQPISCVQFFATSWTAAGQASLSITNSWSLLKLMSNESVMPSNHLILCHPLLLSPSIIPNIRVFSNESVFPIRWPKFRSFTFSISPSNEYSRLIFSEFLQWIFNMISFRMDWLELLSAQGTLKSL